MEEGILQTESFAALTGFDEEKYHAVSLCSQRIKSRLITKINRIAF